MEFEKRKAATLSALASSKTDKSPKGTLDTHIIPLINTINSHPSYFTTSSCSGRISILSQPKRTSTPPTSKKKARGGSWLYISHDLANPNSLLPLLFPTESPSESTEFPTESASSADEPSESATGSVTELVLRFEPLIIAVECKDIEAAQCLVSFAIRSGFRESGITSANNKRVIAGIRCSIRMEVPLGDSDRILVSEEYVKFLVDVANQKMEANWKRTQGFLSGLIDNGFQTHAVSENGECRDGDDDQSERTANGDAHIGGEKAADCSLPVSSILVAGEPIEKLLLWGHSTCVLDNDSYKSVLVFGGFGGIGRHARRNDCFLLDPFSGKLKATDVEGAPSPRLGHTASLVGDLVFIIGGRADPSNILNDVWVLNTANMEWKLIQCTGSVFSPRHRHAAAAVGSNIYVYGGLNNNDTILSSLHVLNTGDLQWKEVSSDGEQPCARHSHSMLAYGSKVFVFGGYNGEKALGDLYSFDVQTCTWEFSHSMFVYKDFLGVIGGCPVGQHFQELALLDLQFNIWKQITLDYIGKELLVRTTANVVGDDLVIIGGGAACYAFGTKFSKPFKVNLLPLVPLGDKLMPTEKNANASVTHAENAEAEKHQLVSYNRVLQLEKKYAKMGKDILKNFGWLDLGRKVYTKEDGLYICFPITEKFSAMFLEKQDQYVDAFEEGNDTYVCKPFTGGGVFLNEVSCSIALNFLKKCGATNLANEVDEARKSSKSPFQTMNESIALLIKQKDLTETLLEELPNRWERLGDIVVLPASSFKDPIWDSISEELWPIVAKSLKARRVARQGRVASTGTRDSTLEILIGDNGWVDHREMEFSIPSMLQSACSPGAIFLRSFVWEIWSAKMKL
ncbi:Met-10++ family protein [Salix suchowensis]|nr:Met-10++ family protein [Salix suchowensis]